MTKEEDADQLLAMKWANETVPGWRNTYDLIRRVRSEERESRLRAERERDELRAALKKAHQTEAGFLDRCHEMLDHGGIREHAYCLNVLDDLVRALSSPSVTTGGQEAGANAPAPPMEPCACSSCGFDAERCACATPVFVAKASMSAEPANHAEAGEELRRRVFEALGAASMCWTETPHGIFESDRAKRIGDDLVAWLASGTPRAAPSKTSEGA